MVVKHADEIKHLYKEPRTQLLNRDRLYLIMQNLAKSICSPDRDASILFDVPLFLPFLFAIRHCQVVLIFFTLAAMVFTSRCYNENLIEPAQLCHECKHVCINILFTNVNGLPTSWNSWKHSFQPANDRSDTSRSNKRKCVVEKCAQY